MGNEQSSSSESSGLAGGGGASPDKSSSTSVSVSELSASRLLQPVLKWCNVSEDLLSRFMESGDKSDEDESLYSDEESSDESEEEEEERKDEEKPEESQQVAKTTGERIEMDLDAMDVEECMTQRQSLDPDDLPNLMSMEQAAALFDTTPAPPKPPEPDEAKTQKSEAPAAEATPAPAPKTPTKGSRERRRSQKAPKLEAPPAVVTPIKADSPKAIRDPVKKVKPKRKEPMVKPEPPKETPTPPGSDRKSLSKEGSLQRRKGAEKEGPVAERAEVPAPSPQQTSDSDMKKEGQIPKESSSVSSSASKSKSKGRQLTKRSKRLFSRRVDFDSSSVAALFSRVKPEPEDNVGPWVMRIVRADANQIRRPLKEEPFFHGLTPRTEVEKLLEKKGEFLVRETEIVNKKTKQQQYVVTISVRWNKLIKHFLIQNKPSGRIHVGNYIFDTVRDMVDWHRATQSPLTPESGVKLRTPVYRANWQFKHDQIKLLNKIGEGSFGEVHRGVLHDQSGTFDVAVKNQHGGMASRQERLDFLAEFNVMRRFHHPNVVFVYGVAVLQDPIMIVMEYLPGGSLLGYLRKQNTQIRLDERLRFCMESAAGMAYLAKHKCLHRDVAARNCLLSDKLKLKISDFGLSRFDAMLNEKKGHKAPIRWSAPETLIKSFYSPETDVWSYGVLVWEIFSDGKTPYSDLSNAAVRQKVCQESYRLTMPSISPPVVNELVLKCWNLQPEKRPKFVYLNRKLSTLYNSLKSLK